LPEVTKRATCTQAQVRRIIRAVELEGLRIIEIRPDGTVVVRKRDEQQTEETESLVSEHEVVL
jgi:hypothetical protein